MTTSTTRPRVLTTADRELLAARLDAIAAALLDERTCKAGFEYERLMGWLGSLTRQTAEELHGNSRGPLTELSPIWPERTTAFLDELAARATSRKAGEA